MEEAERARSQEDGLRELFPCLTVQGDWQSSAEARGFINALLKRNKRKTFGKVNVLHFYYPCLLCV